MMRDRRAQPSSTAGGTSPGRDSRWGAGFDTRTEYCRLGDWVAARAQSKLVGRALDAGRALVQDMGIDLRRTEIAGAKQLLHGPDVVSGLEEVGGE